MASSRSAWAADNRRFSNCSIAMRWPRLGIRRTSRLAQGWFAGVRGEDERWHPHARRGQRTIEGFRIVRSPCAGRAWASGGHRDCLKGGSPAFAVKMNDGILTLGVGSGQSKVFELFDRHALAALGHPADIEKIRQAAIDAAHMEAFTLS